MLKNMKFTGYETLSVLNISMGMQYTWLCSALVMNNAQRLGIKPSKSVFVDVQIANRLCNA